MDYLKLFEAALGLTSPWHLENVSFDPKADGVGAVELRIGFARGSRFACPECQALCPAHDTHEQRWRHLNFFQYRAYIVADIPRVDCKTHGIRTFSGVSWARAGSGFTLLFEALLMLVAREMPMAAIARMTGEHDTRLWRVVHAHVDEARERVDMRDVRELVVDETSRARGHDYVSLFVEPGEEQARVLFVADGRTRVARPAKGQSKTGLEPMARVAKTIRENMRGILNYFRRRLTSGVIEGINSMAQAARARARGYRNAETFKAMIYLLAGRLQFNLPSIAS